MTQINRFKEGDVLRWTGNRQEMVFSDGGCIEAPAGTLGVVTRSTDQLYDVRLFIRDGVADEFCHDADDTPWEKLDD